MWHLAKMVSQNVKDNAKGGGDLLRLDVGEIEEETPSRLSKRRKKRRR